MMTNDAFRRTLATWLHEDARHHVPDHLAEVLQRTATTRQRPAWSSLERWLPVQTTLRLAPFPSASWLLVVLALLVALVVAGVIGSQPRVPNPFGPAVNGTIVYGAPNGDIYSLDPATGISTAIVTGPTRDRAPSFSSDGSRFVFARETASRLWQLIVVKADGTQERALTGPLVPQGFDWSPDGSGLAVADASSSATFTIVSVEGGPARVVDLGMKAEDLSWRPSGEELVFRGVTYGQDSETYGLYVVRADGTGLRPIAPPTDSGDHWQWPALSPDGTRILYTQWDPHIGGRLFVVEIDGGQMQRLEFDGPLAADYYAQWSPDGEQIAFHRWRGSTYHLAVAPSGGGHAVEIGPAMPQSGGAAQIHFSPDGSRLIARYDPDGSTWLLDVAGGPGERIPASDQFLATWQRLAP